MSASPGEARCTKGYPSGSPQQSAAQQQPGQHQLLDLPRSVTTAAQPQSWKPLQPLQRQATNKVTMWVSPCRPRQRHLGALSCGACCGRSGVPLRRIVRAHKACAAARAAAASHEAPHSHQCRSQVRQKSDMLNALGSWAAPRNRRPLDPARTRATSESTGCLALSIMSAGKKPPWVSRRRMHHAAGAGARPQAGWGGGRCAGKNLKKKEVFFPGGWSGGDLAAPWTTRGGWRSGRFGGGRRCGCGCGYAGGSCARGTVQRRCQSPGSATGVPPPNASRGWAPPPGASPHRAQLAEPLHTPFGSIARAPPVRCRAMPPHQGGGVRVGSSEGGGAAGFACAPGAYPAPDRGCACADCAPGCHAADHRTLLRAPTAARQLAAERQTAPCVAVFLGGVCASSTRRKRGMPRL